MIILYVGIWLDENDEAVLDLECVDQDLDAMIVKYYQDMLEHGKVSGGELGCTVEEQLDALKNNYCYVLVMDDEDIEGLRKLII